MLEKLYEEGEFFFVVFCKFCQSGIWIIKIEDHCCFSDIELKREEKITRRLILFISLYFDFWVCIDAGCYGERKSKIKKISFKKVFFNFNGLLKFKKIL